MRPELVTFDCYGTLIDWNGGILAAFRAEGARHGESVDDAAVLAAYHRAEPRVQAGPFRSYRQVLGILEDEIARQLGWPEPGDRAGHLAASLPGWRPFDDTVPALRRLRAAGHALGILSNVDDDLLAGTLAHLPVEFDLLVTAEQVGGYKPGHGHFHRALDRVGRSPDRLLHVAQSWFHDVEPATTLGIPTIWVNRLGEERPDPERDIVAEVPDLTAAVETIEGEP